MSKTCATCAHWADEFPSWFMDFCNREDSPCSGNLMNRDDHCSAWEPKEETEWDDALGTCGGCKYWDGDDGRCHNAVSPRFMHETDDGCEKREG